MTKHTTAPWEFTASTPEDGFECFFIYAGEGYSQRQIATVNGPQDEKGEANARLIAATPELLEALKHAENALADYVPTIEKTGAALNYGHHVIKMAKAAIAKATGEQA